MADPLILAAPPRLSLPALQAVLAEAYGLAGDLAPLGGERDRNFRLATPDGTALLVKLAHPAEDPAITDFQTAAMLHLAAADPDLPVQRMRRALDGRVALPFETQDGICQLRVLSFLPGTPMGAVDAAQCHRLGGFAARIDLALRDFAHPAATRRLLWDIRETGCFRRLLPEIDDPAWRALVAATIDRFEAEVTPALPDLPSQVIHNDLNPHNVLIDSDAPGQPLGVIDFGDMLRAPRVQEVATACAYLLRPGAAPLARPAAFIAGYAAAQPLTALECRLLPLMAAMRMGTSIAVTSWRARRQPENAAYIRRNLPSALAGLDILSRLDPAAAARDLRLMETAADA